MLAHFTVGIFPAYLFGGRKDFLNRAAQESHPGDVEQRLQWRNQRLNGAFIKTRAHTQFRLWRNHRNINVLLIFIRQTCGAQRCPHTGKASAHDQNLFTHWSFSLVTMKYLLGFYWS